MSDIIDYNSDLEYLLKIHAEECESFSILHRYSFEKYSERSNYINIPVIILSSAIGFATGIDIGYDKMNIILGVSSIFVGIIKSIDTYFQLGKRSEAHRLCSLQFQQINKKIMIELSLKRDQRISAKDMLQIIKTDIKNLQDIAPLIDEAIVETFKKNYGILDASSNKIKFTSHTPNLCNGLSQVTINGEKSNEDDEDDEDGEGRRRRRRRRNGRGSRGSRGSGGSRGSRGSHGSRGSRGSRGSESDDDDSDDNGSGNRGGHRRNSNNNNNNRNDTKHPSDGNISGESASSGFMSSVSNFIQKGVNLIKGSTPPPTEPESHNKVIKSHSNSRNSSRNHHKKITNSVIELTSVTVDGNNNINELTDIVNNKLPSSNSVPSIKSTPSLVNNNEDTLALTETHLQQLQQLHQLQQLQQLQQQQQQLQQQMRSPSNNLNHTPHTQHSYHSQHSQASLLSQTHFNPLNFTNTISPPVLVASAELTYNNNSHHTSRVPSLVGSRQNSVIGSNTPRVINENDPNDPTAPNQVIEIHEIETSPPTNSIENLKQAQAPILIPIIIPNLIPNPNPNSNPDDDGAFM